jgi:hypothetical protein
VLTVPMARRVLPRNRFMETEKLEQAAGRAARGEAAIEEVPRQHWRTQYSVLCMQQFAASFRCTGGDWSRALPVGGAGR